MSKHSLSDRSNRLDEVILEIKSRGGDKSATLLNSLYGEIERLGVQAFVDKNIERVEIPKTKDKNGKFATDKSVNKSRDLSKFYERLSYKTVQNFMIERGTLDVVSRVIVERFDKKYAYVSYMSDVTCKYKKAVEKSLNDTELKICDVFGVNHTERGFENTMRHYQDSVRMVRSIKKADIKNKKFDLSVSSFNPLYVDVKVTKLNRSQKLTFELYSNVLFYVNKDIILRLAREGKFDRERYEKLVERFNSYLKRLQKEAKVNYDGGSAYARLKILQEVIDSEKLQ